MIGISSENVTFTLRKQWQIRKLTLNTEFVCLFTLRRAVPCASCQYAKTPTECVLAPSIFHLFSSMCENQNLLYWQTFHLELIDIFTYLIKTTYTT